MRNQTFANGLGGSKESGSRRRFANPISLLRQFTIAMALLLWLVEASCRRNNMVLFYFVFYFCISFCLFGGWMDWWIRRQVACKRRRERRKSDVWSTWKLMLGLVSGCFSVGYKHKTIPSNKCLPISLKFVRSFGRRRTKVSGLMTPKK